MDQFNYYAVVGANGIAVMDSWHGVQNIRKYLRKLSVKGFDTFHEAEDWALLMFEDRFPYLSGLASPLQLNRIVFAKKLQQELEGL